MALIYCYHHIMQIQRLKNFLTSPIFLLLDSTDITFLRQNAVKVSKCFHFIFSICVLILSWLVLPPVHHTWSSVAQRHRTAETCSVCITTQPSDAVVKHLLGWAFSWEDECWQGKVLRQVLCFFQWSHGIEQKSSIALSNSIMYSSLCTKT